ncbi:unnamed protein product [Acanthoscelides obtectus]|uniref:Tyrosine-protein kinase receptor n=1 Tax=Acanthoscelides obtectus TaxID=200917 RepID=A0A9P0L1K4_ACAOB|nr:unnamed protein product [Acanthoscelides obtectus]CAK1676118.1 ALK tyrosine kinase receptor [Acanthoscelides obtectus]
MRFALPFLLSFLLQHAKTEDAATTDDTQLAIFRDDDVFRDIFGNRRDIARIRYFRSKRNAIERSISTIRKKLNDEKKKEEKEWMAADANPRLEPNETGAKLGLVEYEQGESKQSQQAYNKRKDKIVQLFNNIRTRQQDFDRNVNCDFEDNCLWSWRKDIANGFFIASGHNVGANETGPRTDAENGEFGSFLLLRLPQEATEFQVKSPIFTPTISKCKFAIHIHQEKMQGGLIKIIGEKKDSQWILKTIPGDDARKWTYYEQSVGQISQNFTIMLEVVPGENMAKGATVAFDNIKLFHCYETMDDSCSPHQYKCKKGTKICINTTSICDITKDCDYGDDETQNCDMMPYGARCTFEDDWCGWQNIDIKVLEWARHNGSTPTHQTGPNYDHTYRNTTGKYLFVNMLKENANFASMATLRSVYFNPPPRVHGNSSSRFYNSCAIRFYLHKTGKHRSSIQLQVTEMRPSENVTKEMLWSYRDFGDQWVRQVFILPNISCRYFLHFEAKKGVRYMSDVAIDDVSLSPECFGLNIPEEELQGYNYWNPVCQNIVKETHQDFVNKTYYKISTCGAKGRYGPSQSDCNREYENNKVSVRVLKEPGLDGVQKWVAPRSGYYTFILAGASGGKGSSGMGSSRGAMVRTILNLQSGQEVLMLVGQEGMDSCIKMLGSQNNSSCHSQSNNGTSIRIILNMDVSDTGGGGGGGTFVFMFNRLKEKVPLAVAGGGGGLGIGRFSIENVLQHGQAINMSRPPYTGQASGLRFGGGAGGGWAMYTGGLTSPLNKDMTGGALLSGAIGGKACYNSTDQRGDGGFGGGGGGCKYGGGGGGYSGGDAPAVNSTSGEGGYSYIDPTKTMMRLSEAKGSHHTGSGYVVIIPDTKGCNCDYKCVALDAERSEVTCICPHNWKLNDDKKTCIAETITQVVEPYPKWFVVGLIVTILCLIAAFAAVCFILYNRYQLKVSGMKRRKIISGADVQLDRLRGVGSDNMMTEYNPNYEFGGVVYTLKDLKDIPRDQLRLVKALGQGAFGEVYQGFYRQRPCDTVEMPVAVKTLPEMSTSQAEMDFLMEALIMSKFHHPNIVHFIGVCFGKHPRFIVLELLAGGDLKNFLRESRPKPERPSPLSMKDLIMIAIDVAKGCKYLEDNRFIHRDIAARNCLLTTKGPGRVVKIADFGMSRDVYRSDYYRKGGKAMLPIKWMPPEAFLDGIFTSKTDVWSFGVLLWEIMSMGYMPYTGCANRDVMQLVTSGGRLDPPANCPDPVYGIMTQCWHPAPEQRPNFGTILERLGYCAQDPQVMNAALPVFQRPPPYERDTTVMRPSGSEENNCLQVDKLLSITPSESDDVAKSSPNSVPVGNILTPTNNNNNVARPTADQAHQAALKSGVALDAGALAKQAMAQNKKYQNVNPGAEANGIDAFHAGTLPVGQQNKYHNEPEINC